MVETPTREFNLVPNRDCGTCVVCCYAMPIDSPELQKMPGVICDHCTGRGCAIYDRRPPVCEGFFCGWRRIAGFDDDWRPDKSGILILDQNSPIPAHYKLRDGIEFMVYGGEPAVRRPGFIEKVAALVANEIPIFIGVPGPDGHHGTRAFVNDLLHECVKSRDFAGTLALVLEVLRTAKNRSFVPVTFKSRGSTG